MTKEITSWLSESPETAWTKAWPRPVELSIQAKLSKNRTTPRIREKYIQAAIFCSAKSNEAESSPTTTTRGSSLSVELFASASSVEVRAVSWNFRGSKRRELGLGASAELWRDGLKGGRSRVFGVEEAHLSRRARLLPLGRWGSGEKVFDNTRVVAILQGAEWKRGKQERKKRASGDGVVLFGCGFWIILGVPFFSFWVEVSGGLFFFFFKQRE